ncbi:hypothetical protein GOBAR_DD27811 [Gossypium barbadense]|nr:hypothetical protein GOBAR_DD27811 [Gossypium barbadense]
MANGSLVRILIHTGVTKYLNFKAVDGSYVYKKKKIYKVPATDVEALKSPLMGLFEKRRARKFFIYVQDYDENDPKSHEKLDLNKVTAKELISYYGSQFTGPVLLIFQCRKYGLEDDTIDFIGHALALHNEDSYLAQPALNFVKRMKLYAESLARFQGGSPYIYPLYGLGELPQAFARLSAVYGGTYMLNKSECKVLHMDRNDYYGGESTSLNLMQLWKHFKGNDKPPEQLGTSREYNVDMIPKACKFNLFVTNFYVFCCSYAHNVAPKGKYIAFVSAEAETDNPEQELKPGVDLLGSVDEIFYDTYDRYVPTNDHQADNCFISAEEGGSHGGSESLWEVDVYWVLSWWEIGLLIPFVVGLSPYRYLSVRELLAESWKSYDSTTHFETTVIDVMEMYTKITGKVLDLSVDLSAASAAEE